MSFELSKFCKAQKEQKLTAHMQEKNEVISPTAPQSLHGTFSFLLFECLAFVLCFMCSGGCALPRSSTMDQPSPFKINVDSFKRCVKSSFLKRGKLGRRSRMYNEIGLLVRSRFVHSYRIRLYQEGAYKTFPDMFSLFYFKRTVQLLRFAVECCYLHALQLFSLVFIKLHS